MAPSAPAPRWLQAYTNGQSALEQRRASKERPAGGATSVSPTGIPALLRNRHQWALWRYTTDSAGRTSKPPYQPDGSPADGRNPGTWSSFQQCFDAYREGGWDGLSYAFVESQDLLAFDLDHFREHKERDAAIIAVLDSYTEWSPSGDGVHVWVMGRLPEGRRRRDDIEIYSRRRFLSVTGQLYPGAPSDIRPSRTLHAVWDHWLEHG